MILPKNRTPELYEWLESKLEEIGLSGRVYSRLIQSIMSLDSSCLKSELEAMIDVKKKDELLAREVLLAAQWKGSKESEDYWSFREIISKFLKKYQTQVSTTGRSEDDEFCDEVTKQSGEKYEEAFPSLSNACDEIAWDIMNNARNWSCLASPHNLSMLLAARKSTSSVLNVNATTKYYLGSYCIDEVEMYLKKRLDAASHCFYRGNPSKKQPPRKMYRRKRGEQKKQYADESSRLIAMQKKCCQHCSKRSQNKPVNSPLERIYSVPNGKEIGRIKERKVKVVSSDESTSTDEFRSLPRRNRRKLCYKSVTAVQKESSGLKKDVIMWYDRMNNKCVVNKNCKPPNVWSPTEKLTTTSQVCYPKYEVMQKYDSAASDMDLGGLVEPNSWNEWSVTEKFDEMSSDFRSASDVSNGPVAHSTPKKDDVDEDNVSSLIASLPGPVSDQSNVSDFFAFDFANMCNVNSIQLPEMSENFNLSQPGVEIGHGESRSGITGRSRRKLFFDGPSEQLTLPAPSGFEDFLASKKKNKNQEGVNVDAVHEMVWNLLERSFVEKTSSGSQTSGTQTCSSGSQPSGTLTSSSDSQQVSQPLKSSNGSAEDNNEFWHGFWSYDGVVALQKNEPVDSLGVPPKKSQKVSPLGVQLETSTLCEENDGYMSHWFTPWKNKKTKDDKNIGLDFLDHPDDFWFA